MMKLAAVLSFRVARSLSMFRYQRSIDKKTTPDGLIAAPAKAFDGVPASSSSHTTHISHTNNFMKLHWSAVRVLAATFALLIMTACGGGWGGITQPPVITGQPASQTVNVGQTATFTVTATGAGSLTYQWYDNGTAISGATSSSYTTPAAASTDSGSIFTVTVTNAGGTVTSTPATLTVSAGGTTVNPDAPLIVTQPANQTVAVGQTATFSVTATGSATLTYQWYKGGVLISGATSSTYTTPATVSSDTGSLFTVTVSNSLGTVTSSPATLTVTTPTAGAPTITSEPVSQTVTAGQTATFSVTASGTGPLTYQWYDNGTPIGGATSTTYTTPPTTSGNSGSVYTVTVTNSGGTATGGPATLTVITAPLIVTQPANQTVSVGKTATFSVSASGTAPLTYQWYKNGALFPGATSTTYTTPAAVLGDSGSLFTIIVTNAAGTVTGGPATLTVVNAPLIVTQPANQTVSVGQTATFSVSASGTAPLTYQWYKNGALIPGATSTTYTTPAAVLGDNGSLFTIIVTNTAGTATGGPATLTVNTAPTITTEPANQTVNAGQTATFNVVASGTGPLTYQWYKGGVAIGGATSSTYTTPATVSGDSGSIFTVTVTNAGGTVTSTPATLTVNTPPVITSPPANQTVTVGLTAIFSVTATGTAPLTYQWSKNGTAIPGATSSSYTTPATVLGDTGSLFSVTVTNTAGSATGGPATLTVNSAPTVTSQPANQTVNVGQTATFSVTASGPGTLTYQWYKNGTLIPGATSTAYTTPTAVSGDSGSHFTVIVTNSSGTATGGPATLTVNTPPTITTEPANQAVTVGQTATFSVVATGTAPLTYQWYKGGVAIGGATSSTYTTPAAVLANNNSQYTVIVTNVAGSATSTIATLTVTNSIPVASFLTCSSLTPPYNTSVNLIPSFSGGTGVIGSTGVGSLDITGSAVSGSSYPTPLITSAKTYTLTVTGTGGATAFTTCTAVPSVVTISPITPANETIAPGNQTFSATVSGGATDHITWTATGGTFVGNVWTSPNTAGTYTITATSVDEPSIFTTTTVTVSAPVITVQPSSQVACTNSTLTLSVTALYAATYQWYLNGTLIPGATSSSYMIASAIAMDAGSYTVVVTNPAGSVTSTPAKIVVGLTVTISPTSLSILVQQTATFTVTAVGEPPFTYQWYVIAPGTTTGTEIAGATSSTYTTPAATNAKSDSSQYYAMVTDACGTVTSPLATLLVSNGGSSPTIITQPVSQTVAVGGTATFTVVAAGTPNLSYQWYRVPAGSTPGTSDKITGATSASYTVPSTATAITNNQDGYYVIVTNLYGQAVSVTATLAVGSGILITKQPVSVNVNVGASATFSVTATSTLPLTYQWYEAPPPTNGGSSTFAAIPGATSSSYTLASVTTAESNSLFYVVVSNSTPTSVTSDTASLTVGTPAQINNFCTGWTELGNALPPTTTPTVPCSIQLVTAAQQQQGEIVWPTPISTANIQLAFTITTSNSGNPPADGFALVLGDPSLGATTSSVGLPGEGLGAEGIPGFVLAFDDYEDTGDAPVPYLAVERGEIPLWENNYTNLNTTIPTLAIPGETVAHTYTVSIVNGMMTVTMDGTQVFSGTVSVPPVAYLYFTASTGADYETTVVSDLSGTISAP
jgi:hypothetical protein